MSAHKRVVGPNELRYVALAARQLFSVIFIVASAGHFTAATIESAAVQGVPMAGVLVPLSGFIALAGGLSVLFGYQARLGALLLVLFLVPVTLVMHPFWAVSDPAMFPLQLAWFVRNVLMLGAALRIAQVGAGSLSLDALLAEPVAADCVA